jgi:hypothetical protein
MRLLLQKDLEHIIQILANCASWGTVDSRENFLELAIVGLEKSEKLVADIEFSGNKSNSAREAVLTIQEAGNSYFQPFLSTLQRETYDEQDVSFLKGLLESRETGGGIEVPPDMMVFEVGRFKTLARIGRVMELAMAGESSGAGIIIFQGDVKLDCTPGFLMRLRWDRDNGVSLYTTPQMRCWANWEPGKQVELTDSPVEGEADRDGSKRTDWCLEELMKRFSRPDQRRRGNVRQEFLRLVSELEHSTYFLVHTLNTSEPVTVLDAFLQDYLSFWKTLELSRLSGVRFLVLIRVDTKGNESQNLQAIREAVAHVLGRPPEEIATGGILAEETVGLSFHPKLEDVSLRDAERWLEKLNGKIDEGQQQGFLSFEDAYTLKEEVAILVNEPLFSAGEGQKKMGEVEPVLRRTYDRFLTTLGRGRQNA